MDDDPFILEARKHATEANRIGRIAFQAFLSAIVAFVLFGLTIDQSWCWWFWLASAIMLLRMMFALESRWFHRKAARVALEFHTYSKAYEQNRMEEREAVQ